MNNPFQIMNKNVGTPYVESSSHGEPVERIKKMISENEIFLFMKGIPTEPMCGFSANLVAILNNLGREYQSFNVLSDESIRQGVKDFAQWPTFPQLYFKGELLGGNDIITAMYESGELQTKLNV